VTTALYTLACCYLAALAAYLLRAWLTQSKGDQQ
jgi:hypothetical protein